MILAVIVSFFACNTLTIVIRWLDILDPQGSNHPSRWLIADISNFLVNVSSTGNPFIYFICTRRFKDLYMEIRGTSGRNPTIGQESRPLLHSYIGRTDSANTRQSCREVRRAKSDSVTKEIQMENSQIKKKTKQQLSVNFAINGNEHRPLKISDV